MPLILVTNDDGVNSQGLLALFESMKQLGRAVIVAPESEHSACSHSLTLRRPLKVNEIDKDVYSIDGTPTDCVNIAVNKILDRAPDLVASGINKGGNLGDDITYSGTVSAAIEGTIFGIPSFAVSLVGNNPFRFNTAAHFALKLSEKILSSALPENTLLNMNIPNVEHEVIAGVKFTGQGKRLYSNAIQEICDPWGRKHFWIGGGTPSNEYRENTDICAVESNYVSITPIRLELTDYKTLEYLKKEWNDF